MTDELLDGWIVIPLLVSAVLYGIGSVKAWRGARALAYFTGWLTLALALLSPFHSLAEHLFTWHMVEHEIIMAVSAPLLVLGRPIGVLLWGLPHKVRLSLTHATRQPVIQRCWSWLTRPLNATLIHAVAIWVWHAPPLFDAAVTHEVLHRLQHLSFLVSALLFWYSLLRTSRSSGEALWHLFFTMLHMSLLGALLALSPRVLYLAQTAHSLAFGLTPLEDQQLAGIVMWVPAGTLYAGAALFFAARWIRPSKGRQFVRSGSQR
jgi:putative membrane protein